MLYPRYFHEIIFIGIALNVVQNVVAFNVKYYNVCNSAR